MSDTSCDSCFNEQRSLNDQTKQKIIDVQAFANKEKKVVAVFSDGSFQVLGESIPPGCIQLIQPASEDIG